MRILMIAPEPFFEPRGTPLSEYHRIGALCALGHTVDLVTYPFGRDVSIPGLSLFRCARPPFMTRVGAGPSFAKIPLDLALGWTVARRALRNRYDAIHSHEEAGAMGVMLASLLRIPHVYDMHSSLPQQLSNFSFSRSRLLRWAFGVLERMMIRRSDAIIVICPYLENVVRLIDPNAQVVLIENSPSGGQILNLESDPRPRDPVSPLIQTRTSNLGCSLREELGLDATSPVVLYTGTFEPYQGLSLLFASLPHLLAVRPDARCVLVGGRPDQIARAQHEVKALEVAHAVIFAGQREAEEIPGFLAVSDVLVSPRCRGTNTPLKIYQYLRSGKPMVATRLVTHTQVLDDQVAVLTDATPQAFAAGITDALQPERAEGLARRARELAETKYSYEAYLEKTQLVYSYLAPHQSTVISRPSSVESHQSTVGSHQSTVGGSQSGVRK